MKDRRQHRPPGRKSVSRICPGLVAASVAIVTLLASVHTRPAVSQDRDERPVLPDLAPREVEIRGELEVRFPLLDRQPLVGFNPPPRIPELPAGRRPIVDEYKQARSELPQSTVERPDAPSAAANADAIRRGEIEAAAGSYFDRLVRARVTADATERTRIRASLDYLGSDGQQVVAVQTAHNPFDSIDGALGVEHSTRSARLSADLSAFSDSYPLYGLASQLDTPDPNRENGPERTIGGLGFGVGVASPRTNRTMYDIRARWSFAEFETVSSQIVTTDEKRVEVGAGLTVPAGAAAFTVDANAGTSGFNASGFTGATQQYVDAAVGISLPRRSTIDGHLAARIVGTRYDAEPASAVDRRELLYLSPDVSLRIALAPGAVLFAENVPSVEPNGLQSTFRRSPFLVAGSTIGPSVNVIDARGGVRFTLGSFVAEPYGGYRWSPNQLYFASSTPAAVDPDGVILARSGKVATIVGGLGMSFGLTGALTASVSGEYRDPRLTVDDTAVPYMPAVVATGGATVRFLRNGVVTRLQARYEAARHVEESGTRELDPITSIDFFATYDVTRNIGLTFRALNLTDSALERWDTYRMTGRQFLGGLRFRW